MHSQVQREESLVLLIDNVDHEGVRSVLRHAGRRYIKKSLYSKPQNWQSIVDLLDSMSVSAALVKFSVTAYLFVGLPEYKAVADSLFSRIAKVPHAIYVFEGLFTGEVDDANDEDEWAGYFSKPDDATRRQVNHFLAAHSLNVVTYKRNSEVTVLAQEFLAQCETGLLLRLYVPNNQLWANETDRFLQLFRDYLARVASLNVRLDQTRTSVGVIYELHSDPDRSVDIQVEFDEFSHFINLCVIDAEQAQLLLRSKNISETNIAQILVRYSKEARRLQVDLRQEREQKVLLLQHRLEAELLDTLPSDVDIEAIRVLVDAAVPAVFGPQTPLLVPSATQKPQSITLNINPQFVETVNGVVAREVSGDMSFGDRDNDLLRLFAEYAGERQAELVSALRELNDESAPSPGRLNAKQKIKMFLFALGSKVTDLGFGVLQNYLESKFLGS